MVIPENGGFPTQNHAQRIRQISHFYSHFWGVQANYEGTGDVFILI